MPPTEIQILRLGYLLLFVALGLMTWAYLVRAEAFPFQSSGPSMAKGQLGSVLDDYPACSWNPLCKCSNPGPTDFGIVSCHRVPFGNLPSALKTNRAFVLSMVENGLDFLEDRQLVGTALWRLEIRSNKLSSIGNDSLIGFEKSLWELDLQNNELTQIPSVALRLLLKLKLLDLSWNKITDVDAEDFQGLQGSLTFLSLAGNLLVNIPEGTFANLQKLERLDLSYNSLRLIQSSAFVQTTNSLSFLLLSGNLLRKIPFESLSGLKLDLVDLSYNLIPSTYDPLFDRGKLQIQQLRLDGNQIRVLEPFAFQNLDGLSSLSLQYNPITILDEDAFKGLNLRHLDLSHCSITHIHPAAFQGMQSSLQELNLGFNNISALPLEVFDGFSQLQSLNLDENEIILNPKQLDHLRYTLERLSLIGDRLLAVPFMEFKTMRNLRKLNVSTHAEIDTLISQTFEGFGPAVEEIRFSRSRLKGITNEAFLHVPGVKVIDLSSNRINRIDNDAFAHVGHSLLKLRLRSALRVTTVPPLVWEKLSKLQELDISGNNLQAVPADSFLKNAEMTYLNLRFNGITELSPNLLEPLTHLHRLFLSFNHLTTLHTETFNRLKDLELVQLNENLLGNLEPRSFLDLPNLRIINLAGNRLWQLKDETFQNIPKLQWIDLSYNKLTTFNIDAFEQIGTLSQFLINLSHNKISRLTRDEDETVQKENGGERNGGERPTTDAHHEEDVIPLSSSSIEGINLSYNNISYIAPHFFTPIGNTLLELDLSYNKLQNLSKAQLDGMKFLQRLHLEHNRLESLDYDTLRGIQGVQMVFLNGNSLRDITPDLFEGCTNLRVLSLHGNRIRALPDSLFKDSKLEILDVGDNLLVRFPESALSRTSTTLVRLDLSGNSISSLSPTQLEALTRLRWLNLASNRIVVIADGTFDGLQNLVHLDLSGNPLGRISVQWFESIKKHLLHLHLSNMSLESLPDFAKFSSLLTFNVSRNFLTYLPTNFGVNVSTLRTLDISTNEIPAPPNTIWHTIPRLSSVSLQSNPIRVLSNDSFLQLDRLHHLDVSALPLELIQIGTFSSLNCLKELSLGPLGEETLQQPAAYIHLIQSLQSLNLKVSEPRLINELRTHPLPWKLGNITIQGPELRSIDSDALDEVSSPWLKLIIDDTGLTELPESLLQNLGSATTLSLHITGNNSLLAVIGNPNREYRPTPRVTFLASLNLNPRVTLSCSCDSGWIEFWARRWMDETCPITSLTPKDDALRCDSMLRSLRAVDCREKLDTSLVEALVTDLDCGWEGSGVRIRLVSIMPFLCLTVLSIFP